MGYSPELKEAMLRRLLPPNNESVAKVSREEGIPQQTLTRWKNEAKANGTPAPTGDNADSWSTQDKFLIVVETASMPKKYVSYCKPRKISEKRREEIREQMKMLNTKVIS